MDEAFCSEHSRAGGESIIASAASDTWVWLMLEVREAWAAKAPESAQLPPAVRERFDGWLAAIPGTRPQLIRRPRSQGPLSFYVGVSKLGRASLVKFELESYDELLSIRVDDVVDAMLEGQPPRQGTRCDVPAVFVCTHGKRDRCCAKWGQPIFDALCSVEGLDVWQTSHLGGHRFAPTLLVLPSGLCYGRVEPSELDDLVSAIERGHVWRLDRLRGRTALSSRAMAAEHFVREHTGNRDDHMIVVDPSSIVELGGQAYRARACAGATHYELEYAWVPNGNYAPASCGKDPAPIHRVELRELKAVD